LPATGAFTDANGVSLHYELSGGAMFFRRGTLHLVQPVLLCKQAAAHYTCRQGIALVTGL
jgi:hypothetical protein